MLMLTVKKRTQLTRLDLQYIRHLAQECSRFEELTMKLNWKTLQSRPGTATDDFLMFVDGQLIGYLALYLFNKKESEVSAMTHPHYRRQGIFKQLLSEARQSLVERHIPDLLFICEQKSKSAQGCMAAIGSQYEFTEYKMTLEQIPAYQSTPHLELRPAQPEDFSMMAQMDQVCFNVEPDMTFKNLTNDERNRHERCLIVLIDGKVGGKIQITIGTSEIYLFGICILPEFRGQGYGQSMLTQVVNQLSRERHQPISLEVASANRQALNLYYRCGFREVTAYDYYRQTV